LASKSVSYHPNHAKAQPTVFDFCTKANSFSTAIEGATEKEEREEDVKGCSLLGDGIIRLKSFNPQKYSLLTLGF